MRTSSQWLGRTCLLLTWLGVCTLACFAQGSGTGVLGGRVEDETHAVIIDAEVVLTDAAGTEKRANTDAQGSFSFAGLSPGRYQLRIIANGFAPYESSEVEVVGGRPQRLEITLAVALEQVQIDVAAQNTLDDPTGSLSGATILQGADLDALPDDPDALGEALLALAGPVTTPGGNQFSVDGFTGGRLPSKQSISKIVVNQNNPFSAEYDRLGLGRVEVYTKPGTIKLQGHAAFYFNDESLNTRNPYAPQRGSFQERRYEGSLGGTLVPKRVTFFVDFNRRETDDNAVVNAVVLDSALRPTSFTEIVLAPQERTLVSPRIDVQINPKHTLFGRYRLTQGSGQNSSVGAFTLSSRGLDVELTEHVAQLTETAILSPKVVNETQFQFVREKRSQTGDTSRPSVSVLGAFDGGGAQLPSAFTDTERWEAQNYTAWNFGQNFIKFGGRARYVRVRDLSEQNFNGTYIFGSLDEYRAVLRRTPGIRPQLFTLAGGEPEAVVGQWDFAGFFQGTVQATRNLTLSAGARYETQTNIPIRHSLAPRASLAFVLDRDARKTPKMVVRAGFGIFYERVNESLALATEHFDGINQQSVNVLFPNFFPNAPSIETLLLTRPQFKVTRRLEDELQAPYTMQTVVAVERKLPFKIDATLSYIHTRTLHALRSRDVNAFLPEGLPTVQIRPLGFLTGDIFQYESSGVFNQHQLVVNLNARFARSHALFATYTYGRAMGDTEGAESFAANPYDLSGEYGRSSLDMRHRLFVGGTYFAPLGLQLNPFVVYFSGRPFNITTGDDPNRDRQFVERPSFAVDLTNPNVVRTPFGDFNRRPIAGQTIIPRNFGEGPGFFIVNLRVGRSFSLGGGEKPKSKGKSNNGRYGLTLSVQLQNIFNHTNPGTLVGNLRSPLFGQTNTTAGSFGLGLGSTSAGNRRIEGQIRFTF